MKMSGIDWDYYHPLDREKWMPKIILINKDKRLGRRGDDSKKGKEYAKEAKTGKV